MNVRPDFWPTEPVYHAEQPPFHETEGGALVDTHRVTQRLRIVPLVPSPQCRADACSECRKPCPCPAACSLPEEPTDRWQGLRDAAFAIGLVLACAAFAALSFTCSLPGCT